MLLIAGHDPNYTNDRHQDLSNDALISPTIPSSFFSMDPPDSANAVQRGGHARLRDPSRTDPSAIRRTHANFLRAADDARYAHGGTTSPSLALPPLDRTTAE